jgi:hypothetical protein
MSIRAFIRRAHLDRSDCLALATLICLFCVAAWITYFINVGRGRAEAFRVYQREQSVAVQARQTEILDRLDDIKRTFDGDLATRTADRFTGADAAKWQARYDAKLDEIRVLTTRPTTHP